MSRRNARRRDRMRRRAGFRELFAPTAPPRAQLRLLGRGDHAVSIEIEAVEALSGFGPELGEGGRAALATPARPAPGAVASSPLLAAARGAALLDGCPLFRAHPAEALLHPLATFGAALL